MRHNLVIKVLHGHGADVPELLQDLVCSRWILICADDPQHGENLVYHLAGDEAAEVDLDELDEGHAEQ